MQMDKLTTGASYGVSFGNAGYWFYRLLNSFSPDQWVAVGVLGSLLIALLTLTVNIGFKVWDRKHNFIRREED